ncbi:MAG TPA: endo-1,4-beta-xylanase [Candidatus Acidoferrales bacterium]
MLSRRKFLMTSTAIAAILGAAYAQDEHAETGSATDVNGPNSLRAHAEKHGLLVGCAVSPQTLTADAKYASLVAEQANILVAENAMKWRAPRPAPDKFDFTGADAILAFAESHNQKLRGHNLCWHEALPDWFASTVTKENARQTLTNHIQTVVSHFAGKIHSWDVVNEAIDPGSPRPDGLRVSPWLELAGEDYIELAFRTAREADPKAMLTYNDYGIELDTPKQEGKRAKVLALVQRLHKLSLIDAVGVQSHFSVGRDSDKGLREFVRQLRGMGLQVFVTELDVNGQNERGAMQQLDTEVAGIYFDYIERMLAEPNVAAVLTWGITDRYSWLNGAKYARPDGQPQRPLPFDADYAPTPAFFAERGALDSRHNSRFRP